MITFIPKSGRCMRIDLFVSCCGGSSAYLLSWKALVYEELYERIAHASPVMDSSCANRPIFCTYS